MITTVISIGHFKVVDVENYLAKGYNVIAYDPRREVYADYLKKNNGMFIPLDYAVLANDGKNEIILKVIRDKNVPDGEGTDCFEGASTYCSKGEIQGNRFLLTDEYPVKTLSLRSVLKEYDEIEELHINCEGEEVPMIMNNGVELFLRCKRIFVEFHCHVPHLNMTEQIVTECVEKWKEKFIPTKLDYKPNYQFDRRI